MPGDCGLAGDGDGQGVALYQLASCPESGHVVGTAGQSDSVSVAHHARNDSISGHYFVQD